MSSENELSHSTMNTRTPSTMTVPTTSISSESTRIATELLRNLTRLASTGTRNVESVPQRSVYSIVGRPPASRIAVEMLPSITIEEKGECVVCLEEWLKGDVATELPCKHKYHLECVKKWLGIHATCPQCRHEMPLECEEDVMKMVDVVDEESNDDSDSEFSDGSDSDE